MMYDLGFADTHTHTHTHTDIQGKISRPCDIMLDLLQKFLFSPSNSDLMQSFGGHQNTETLGHLDIVTTRQWNTKTLGYHQNTWTLGHLDTGTPRHWETWTARHQDT